MKPWVASKDKDEANEPSKDTPAKSAEKPIPVRVPPKPLLDAALEMEHSNPNLCVTFVSLVVTAIVLGICFVVVGIPPLFLDDWTGKRIYVGIMVPLLTLLCTVLVYYVMQHPQRVQNSMLVKMAKEMEQHSAYLSIAVTNVERELTSRGVNLSAMAATSSSFAGGRPRSRFVTPDDQSLQRSPGGGGGGASPHAAPLRHSSSVYTLNGTDFLHGIDKLDEEQDMIIATVHVGKEWKWFKNLLGNLKATAQLGPTYPGITHQRVMVRLLATAIARVEKLILSLYFSSFVLQHVNMLAPLNLWGASALSVGTPGGVGSRGDPYARAAAAMGKAPPVHFLTAPPPRRSSPPLAGDSGSGASLTESTFTLGNTETKFSGAVAAAAAAGGSGADKEEARAFTAAVGALDVHSTEGTHSELTPHSNANGFAFGNKVRLPQFTPLLGSGEVSPHAQKHEQPQQQQQYAAPQQLAGTDKETTKKEAGAAVPASTQQQQRRPSTSASAVAPAHRSVTKVGAAHVLLSEGSGDLTSHGDGPVQEEVEEDVDADVVATPLAKVRSDRQAAFNDDAGTTNRRAVEVVESRGVVGAAAAEGEEAVAEMQDRGNISQGSVFSPLSPVSTHQSDANGRREKMQRAHAVGTPNGRFSSLDNDAPFPGSSPLPTKPPLAQPPVPVRRRQPGTAVVANPTLILHRGARFVNDEDSFFMTILVHVRKSNLTLFSRLYAGQAHTRDDGKSVKHYFANSGDSSLMRRCPYNPLTIFHISDQAGEREGLTVQEQRLLNFVYCRPENQSELDSEKHHPQHGKTTAAATTATDLSSLAVKDGTTTSISSAHSRVENASQPSSLPQRDVTSVYAEEVDAFILAMRLLPDRAMRLTFLPAHIQAVARGKNMSGTFSASLTSLSTKGASPTRAPPAGGATGSEAGFPALKTVPVLECVVNDVLCVLTKMEVTVDKSFQKPSRILLVGVSLEDMSEGSERGVDDEDEDEEDSLMDAKETKKPVKSTEGSPKDWRMPTMATPQGQALDGAAHSGTRPGFAMNGGCTVGQEFREVITMAQESMVTEPSSTTA